MEDAMKSACFEEITHLICDADKKVNISHVSNNWNLSLRDSETILLEWVKENKSKVVSKELLIRGVEKNGNCVITVLPEKKLDAVRRKFDNFCSSLYSIELASESNAKRLNDVKLSDCKVINLPLKQVERDVVVKPLPIPEEASVSKKSAPSLFSAAKPVVKPEIKPEVKVVKDEKTSPEKVEIKTEKETPKKQSPKKKESTKTTKPASGKASIASFFSKSSSVVQNKIEKKEPAESPNAKQSTNQNESPDMFEQSAMDVDEDKESVKDAKKEETVVANKSETVKNNRKRSIKDVDGSDDEIPSTPQESKKIKRSKKKPIEKSSKHSRIMRMEDSSDDDDGHNQQAELLASPFKEKENKTPPKNDSEKVPEKKIKRKAKKTVSRTYQDEQGYLVTTNEVVEYSCSEEENEVVTVEPVKNVKEASAKEPSPDKQKKKKISPPKSVGKQGSILNFFSKK